MLCVSADISGFPEQGNGLYFLITKKVTKKFRPLCGLRRPFRLWRNRAGRSHAARVLLRAQNSLRSFWGPARKPGTFRSAKKHKFQRQQLANSSFFIRLAPIPPGPQPAAQEPGLRPVGLGTRLRAQNGEAVAFFERTRNNKNDIRVLASYGCVEK